MPTAGNTGKLRAAQTLIRSVSSLYSGKTVRLLMDSWYMRGDLILAMLAQEIDVIGQVRHDTRLYDMPATPTKNSAADLPNMENKLRSRESIAWQRQKQRYSYMERISGCDIAIKSCWLVLSKAQKSARSGANFMTKEMKSGIRHVCFCQRVAN
ncbi:MAG: transposase [Cellvibrio sp.]|nr:transposase [Cellvibrio sp.]